MRGVVGMMVLGLLAFACTAQAGSDNKIVSIGSDTMGHLMKNTAEAFKAKHPEVTVEVQEPGSSAGIGAMINGQSDLCPASRTMKQSEYDKFASERGSGFKPIELRVALDGIVIYVSKENPLNEISMDMLCRVFAQNPNDAVANSKAVGPKVTTWGEVDPNVPADWKNAKIVLYGRNAASGTYAFYKEHVLTNHDYDKNCQEMPGTSAVVNGVAKDKFGVGYGGIGYKTQDVKLLSVSAKTGEPAVAPTNETVAQKKYPISRALQIYIPTKPKGLIKEYLDFILSADGQAIIASEKVGFVPLPEALLQKEREKLSQ